MLSAPEAEAGRDTVRIASYIALPLFCLGLIGNGILLRLMMKTEVRQYSSSIFLLGLAIADTIVLIYEVMDDIAIHIPTHTAYDILFGYNQWRCRFGVFFYQTARTVSAWLVVAMSAELCIAATCPMRRKYVYLKNRALYVTMAIVLVAVAAGFPFLVLAEEGTPDDELPSCTSLYAVFFLVYSEFVLKGATQCVFPVLIIIICNLISFLVLAKHKPAKHGMSGHYRDNSDPYNNQSNSARRGAHSVKHIQARNTIRTVTTLYILTVSPATITEIIIMVNRFMGDFGYTSTWNLAVNVTGVLFMANYAVKFYCIVLLGKEYRGAFAGKLDLLYDADEPETNGQISNGVANGGYSPDVRHPSEIRLEDK